MTTLDRALSKGRKWVTIPAMLTFFGVIALCICLAAISRTPVPFLAAALPLSFAAAWLYWSLAVPRWRLWAFSQVTNVHRLRARAADEGLIWPEGSFFERTEIWSRRQKEQWQRLQQRFGEPDVFEDDPAVPSETIIYYSKGKAYTLAALMVPLIAGGLWMFVFATDRGQDAFVICSGLVLTGLGFYGAYSGFKKATNQLPQIRLNEQGIETARAGFQSWADIGAEQVSRERSGKTTRHYLCYSFRGGREKCRIDDLDISSRELTSLLNLYRERYEQKCKQHCL